MSYNAEEDYGDLGELDKLVLLLIDNQEKRYSRLARECILYREVFGDKNTFSFIFGESDDLDECIDALRCMTLIRTADPLGTELRYALTSNGRQLMMYIRSVTKDYATADKVDKILKSTERITDSHFTALIYHLFGGYTVSPLYVDVVESLASCICLGNKTLREATETDIINAIKEGKEVPIYSRQMRCD